MGSGGLSPRGIGVTLCLVAAVAYGSVGIFGKLALEDGLTVPGMLAARFTLAAIVLWLITLMLGAPVRPTTRGALVATLLGLVVYGAQAGFYFWSLTRLEAAFTILLVQVAPILVAVGAVVFRRERLTRRLLVALPIAAAGTALIATGAPVGSADTLGIVLALLCAVAYAAYMLLSHAVVAGLHPVPLAAGVCTGSAIGFGVWALVDGGLPGATGSGWALIVALALVGTVVAVTALAAGTARVGPSTAVLLQTVEPMTATLLAYLILGERLQPRQWLGAGLVVAAVVWLSTARVARHDGDKPPS